jgi:hypothetical protein
MLGRAVQRDGAALIDPGESHLPFEIEVFLAANLKAAAEAAGRAGHGRVDITALQPHRCPHIGLLRHRLGERQHGRQRRDVEPDRRGGLTRLIERIGDHGCHRLTAELDDVFSEQHLALPDRRDVVPARNVGGSDHRMHAWHGLGETCIDAAQLPVGNGARHQRRI